MTNLRIYGTMAVNINEHDLDFLEPGTYTVDLAPGTYQFVIRGAGGAGGENSNTYGGAGGKGLLQVVTETFTHKATATIVVGAGGLTYSGGGNGGSRGDGTDAPQIPGSGGGGGHGSTVTLVKSISETIHMGANGGGGGGGAGGSDTNSSRYSDGGSGGGGGGYYRLNIADGTETSVPGQKGGIGAKVTS